MNEEIFLIDTNILIHAKDHWLGFDIAPSFWEQLQKFISLGRVKTVIYTKKEIEKEEDELKRWFERSDIICLDPKYDVEMFESYTEIVKHLQSSGLYEESSYRKWYEESQADIWLISAAKAHNFTLITHEKSNPSRSIVNPQKKGAPKVPDVANDFSVKVGDLTYLMRELPIIL